MKTILITQPTAPILGKVQLPASKSESNRALIMQALAKYQTGTEIQIDNLSSARDTQTMKRLLATEGEELDVIDAGTTMRFLTAYVAATRQKKILTGTMRMCERPIRVLVEALATLGYQIEYLKNEGYPPIYLNKTPNALSPVPDFVKIRGDVSSQYISALLMIAPILPNGLTIELEGKVASRPYIEMTLSQLKYFGIEHVWDKNQIKIESQKYHSENFAVESDWSGASYWFSVAALAEKAEIELLGLKENSLQGDQAIMAIMDKLGVKSRFTSKGVLLEKQEVSLKEPVFIDFTTCPDLAQTIVALCAVKKTKLEMIGLESLKIKETDRVLALQNEVAKFGAVLREEDNRWFLEFDEDFQMTEKSVLIETYDDHRMAMAFAPLALKYKLRIENPDVVVKSYPHFWEDFKTMDFMLEEVL